MLQEEESKMILIKGLIGGWHAKYVTSFNLYSDLTGEVSESKKS